MESRCSGAAAVGGQINSVVNCKPPRGDARFDPQRDDRRQPTSRKPGWSLGSTVEFKRPDGETVGVPVVGVYELNPGPGRVGDRQHRLRQAHAAPRWILTGVYVLTSTGADKAAVQQRLNRATSEVPDGPVQTAEEFRARSHR